MQEVTREEQGLYRQEFEHDNCGIGAVVNIKGKKTHETVANALRIVEHLEVKMQKVRLVMVSEFFCRFHINFSKKPVRKRALISVMKENMVSHSSSSRSTRSNAPRQKKCSRSSWKKKDWSFSDGETFL